MCSAGVGRGHLCSCISLWVKMNSFSQLKKAKTLLIDDDEQIRDSLRLVFATKGFFIKTAETAEDGLRALEEEKFDIIVSDFRLPGIDGLRFLRFAALIQPDPVKLLITAFKDDNVVTEALRIGVSEFIEKPFSVGALIDLLALTLKNKANKRTINPNLKSNTK